ncbi:MAG: hypothetical protein WCH57_05265 [Verrucomicrobiota bacterium]
MTPPPSRLPTGVWNGKTALLLGAVFLVLFALCTLLVRRDAVERSRLETLTPVPLDSRPPK